MKKLFVLSLLTVVVFSGCYRDVEELLYPDTGTCDTSNVTYSSAVVPLLQSNGCISCHSGGAPSGNLSLEGYANVRIVALNGKLYGSITHAAGFSPMPQGGNKMTACAVNKIKAWIDAGVLNN